MQARAQAKERPKRAAKAEAVRAPNARAESAVRTLPVFRWVARCTEPKPPSPIGSGAISQRTLSRLNFVLRSLALAVLLLKQPIVAAPQLLEDR